MAIKEQLKNLVEKIRDKGRVPTEQLEAMKKQNAAARKVSREIKGE